MQEKLLELTNMQSKYSTIQTDVPVIDRSHNFVLIGLIGLNFVTFWVTMFFNAASISPKLGKIIKQKIDLY